MKRAKGFTTIELLITTIILAIVALIAIPGFSRWLPNYRLRAATRDLFSNFQHARLTAIKRHRTCVISFNQPVSGTTYDYVAYVDTGNNLEFDSAADEVLSKVLFSDQYRDVIFDTNKGVGNDGIDFPGNDDSPPRPTIGFLSNGFTTENDGSAASGSVYLINSSGRTREVKVSAAGNISIIE